MASTELDGPDLPVCPFLGLAADRRSHFTYPHPAHRCFVTERPAKTDARRQAAYCLTARYPACDRYVARQTSREASALPGGTPASALISAGTVIHVFRAGDSLARIATLYGLTVEQIAAANGFTLTDAVADGRRLMIPLGAPAVRVRGRDPRQTAGS